MEGFIAPSPSPSLRASPMIIRLARMNANNSETHCQNALRCPLSLQWGHLPPQTYRRPPIRISLLPKRVRVGKCVVIHSFIHSFIHSIPFHSIPLHSIPSFVRWCEKASSHQYISGFGGGLKPRHRQFPKTPTIEGSIRPLPLSLNKHRCKHGYRAMLTRVLLASAMVSFLRISFKSPEKARLICIQQAGWGNTSKRLASSDSFKASKGMQHPQNRVPESAEIRARAGKVQRLHCSSLICTCCTSGSFSPRNLGKKDHVSTSASSSARAQLGRS